MKMSLGVEWAVHCCVVMSRSDGPVPSQKLAKLHGVSPSYLAKHLQQLARADLVAATEGRVGGYQLTRAAERITVLDVLQAIEGRESAFRCTEIRQNGPLPTPPEACRKPCGVARVFHAAEGAYRAALQKVTIADLAATVEAESGPEAFVALRRWLEPVS